MSMNMDGKALDRQALMLTQEAVRASEAGQWDEVIELYNARGRAVALDKVSPEVARQLVELDRLVRSRTRLVQQAIQADIDRLTIQRRELFRVKRSWMHSVRSFSRIVKSV